MNWPLTLPWVFSLVGTVIAAILVAHLFNYILNVLRKKPIRDALIPVLEFFVVVVVGGSAAHTLFQPTLHNATATWSDDPVWKGIIILAMLAGFTVLSVALYILDKRYGSGSVP